MTRVLLAVVAAYRRHVSPRLPAGVCGYTPTCSVYAAEALTRHGAARGSWLAARRLTACHRWSKRPRLDPVP